MAAVGDLYDLAQEYLEACADAVATAPGGPITYRFVSPGLPSLDCLPQLCVYVGGPIEADTRLASPMLTGGRRADVQGSVHLIQLTAVVARCTPVPKSTTSFPTPAEENAASVQVLGDIWAIWNYVRALYQDGQIFTRADGIQRELFFDPAVPIAISGGAGGWYVPIRTALPGYAPGVGS